jgi:hypothetical protein
LLVIDPKANVTDDNQIVNTNNNVVEEKPTSPVKSQPKPIVKSVSPTVEIKKPDEKAIITTKVTQEKTVTDGNVTSVKSNVAINGGGDTKKAEENGNGVKISTTSSGAESKPLNLQMTAAELRAKLAAKKKYDPKTESVDLRKKYEMIEKM